jgi:hypothetical protein
MRRKRGEEEKRGEERRGREGRDQQVNQSTNMPLFLLHFS